MKDVIIQVFFGIDSFVEYKAESLDDAKRLKELLRDNPLVTGINIIY